MREYVRNAREKSAGVLATLADFLWPRCRRRGWVDTVDQDKGQSNSKHNVTLNNLTKEDNEFLRLTFSNSREGDLSQYELIIRPARFCQKENRCGDCLSGYKEINRRAIERISKVAFLSRLPALITLTKNYSKPLSFKPLATRTVRSKSSAAIVTRPTTRSIFFIRRRVFETWFCMWAEDKGQKSFSPQKFTKQILF